MHLFKRTCIKCGFTITFHKQKENECYIGTHCSLFKLIAPVM